MKRGNEEEVIVVVVKYKKEKKKSSELTPYSAPPAAVTVHAGTHTHTLQEERVTRTIEHWSTMEEWEELRSHPLRR